MVIDFKTSNGTLISIQDISFTYKAIVPPEGGTALIDYDTEVKNKPQINGVTLQGDLSSSDLNIIPEVTSSDAGKFLKVDSSGDLAWSENEFHFEVDFGVDPPVSSATFAQIQKAFADGKLVYLHTTLGLGVDSSILLSAKNIYQNVVVSALGTIQSDFVTISVGFNSQNTQPWILELKYLDYHPGHLLVQDSDYPVETGTTGDESGTIYVKAYSATGSNTDGTMTQKAITDAVNSVLPAVTSVDNGKFLTVQNGVWTATAMSTWQGGSY